SVAEASGTVKPAAGRKRFGSVERRPCPPVGGLPVGQGRSGTDPKRAKKIPRFIFACTNAPVSDSPILGVDVRDCRSGNSAQVRRATRVRPYIRAGRCPRI